MAKRNIYEYNGVRGYFKGTCRQMSEKFDINYNVLRNRLKTTSIEKAVDTPQREKSKIYHYTGKLEDFSGTINAISKQFHIDAKLIKRELDNDISINDIIDGKKKHRAKIIEYGDFKGNIKEASVYFDIPYGALKMRLRTMSVEDALTKPLGNNGAYEAFGFKGTLNEVSNHFGIKDTTILSRLNRGLTLEEAINLGPHNPQTYIYKGFEGTVENIIDKFNLDISAVTLKKKINQGMTIEEAIEDSSVKYKNKKFKNFIELTDYYGLDLRILYQRFHKGFSLEEAIEIPRKVVNKDYQFNGRVGKLKELCDYFNKDFVEVYNKVKHMHTFKWAMETTNEPYHED